MKAGRLDRRITIQRRQQTQSASGEQVDAWANLCLRRAASIWPVRGDERFANPEEVAGEQIEFRIRYSDDVATLNPKDRIIYPAVSEAEAGDPDHVIPERAIHDILAVHEINRREGLKIITNRRPDVTT